MNNIAIIPARSGSKGLKDKNILNLNGKPLLAYSIESASKSKIFNEIMVSTDSSEYADIAKRYGANVPFLRSEKNSEDHSDSWSVVIEVLSKYKEKGIVFDTVCLLQPTSPLRTCNDIKDGYALYEQKDADSIVGVCEADHSPLWCNVLPSTLSMDGFINSNIKECNRQDLPAYYRINGALYIKKVQYLESNIELLDKNMYAYIMKKESSIDIDDFYDFKIAEIFLNNK